MAGFGPEVLSGPSCKGSLLHSVLGTPRLVFSPKPLHLFSVGEHILCMIDISLNLLLECLRLL